MQPVPATVPERLSISAAACSDAAEITYMTPLASLVPSDRHILLPNVFLSCGSWELNVLMFYFTCNLIQSSGYPPATQLAEGWHRPFMQNQWELRDKTRPDLVWFLPPPVSVVRVTGGLALTALFKVANNDNNRIVMLVLIITSSATTLDNKTKLGFQSIFIWATQSVETFMKICLQLFSIFQNPYLRKRPSKSIVLEFVFRNRFMKCYKYLG